MKSRNTIFAVTRSRSECKGKTLRVENRREGRVVFEKFCYEVKPAQAGLVLGWVLIYCTYLIIFFILSKSEVSS